LNRARILVRPKRSRLAAAHCGKAQPYRKQVLVFHFLRLSLRKDVEWQPPVRQSLTAMCGGKPLE